MPVSRKRKYELFQSGNMHCKNASLLQESMTTDVEGLLDDEAVTLEITLFPFLFPHKHGHYEGSESFPEYMKRRIQQLFSPFTLYKPCMLMMYQLRQANHLATMSNTCILV